MQRTQTDKVIWDQTVELMEKHARRVSANINDGRTIPAWYIQELCDDIIALAKEIKRMRGVEY